MCKYLFVFLIIVMSAIVSYARGQAPVDFVRIGLEGGLSQSTVVDITQDNQGCMWFATHDGLNRYDGYNFTVYRQDDGTPESLSGDRIYSLKCDSSDRIWAGTENGLSLYVPEKDSFRNYWPPPGAGTSVTDIEELDKEKLLVVTHGGLLLFDVVAGEFSPASSSLTNLQPRALKKYGEKIYIGTRDDGVFVYSVSEDELAKLNYPQLDNVEIADILLRDDSSIWVATEGKGLFRIDCKSCSIACYNTGNGINSNYVRVLATGPEDCLWVGTFTALNIYDETADSFSTYSHNYQDSESLSHASVRSIYRDNQGGMWVGTFFGGLNYYHPLRNRFRNIRYSFSDNSLNDNIINCIVEDKGGFLWIGTNSGGVNLYNPLSGSFSHYTVQNGLGSNDVKAIWLDEASNLVYIGSHAGGLSILHLDSGRIENYRTEDIRHIYSILPLPDGDLLVSALDILARFNPATGRFSVIDKWSDGTPIETSLVTSIFWDSRGRLWLSGEKGLTVCEPDGQGLRRSHVMDDSPLVREFINDVYEAVDGTFWISTRSGLYSFDEASGDLNHFTTADGLPNNVVYGVLEDSDRKLWMSTNAGLACLQPLLGGFRYYSDKDGLQSNQFNSGAFCRTRDGKMYFGGVNGITTFYPETLEDNPYAPPVKITRLSLFNKTVCSSDETGILTGNISEAESIRFKAWQSMFSIEFVVSNYVAGNHNTFAYMLEGYDRQWHYSDDLRTVSYANLPSGRYKFLVMAANNDGKWCEKPTSLKISILPVWYRTWWAVLLFVLAIIAAVSLVIRYFWVHKSIQAQIQMERIDKQRQSEVNEMKLRFFINISHELRTPLTLILAPLDDLINKTDDRWIRGQLKNIRRNTNRLIYLVNQLMDYRRAELGVFELQVKYTDIHSVIKKDYLFYVDLAGHKKIKYNLFSEVDGEKILCDESYIELIVNNLLSNAFKYTCEGKCIDVILKKQDGWFCLQVRDTGRGIPKDQQKKIFERFYQASGDQVGSGIGLSLVQRLVELHHGRIELDSEVDKGSTFSVYLPTDESAYKREEMASFRADMEDRPIHTTNKQSMYVIDSQYNDKDSSSDGQDAYTARRRECILIVEDNQDLRKYLDTELGRIYRTGVAENGQQALDILREEEIDLILTDVMMPVMDGLQLCRHVKQTLRTCHIPVIMLSAKADRSEEIEGLEIGADDYIPKPFSMAVVTTKIRNLFRSRYRILEHYSQSTEIEPEKMALNPLDEELLKKAVSIMDRHMDDAEFNTDAFAEEMCMSRSNLYLKMKAITGGSPSDFIRKVRFSRACALLKEGRYSVSEISAMVGFNTPSYFSTSFKKYFDCLPSEYSKGQQG